VQRSCATAMGGCARGSCSRAEASLVVSRFDQSGSGESGRWVAQSVGLGYSVLSCEGEVEGEDDWKRSMLDYGLRRWLWGQSKHGL